jgi:DNA-directed RNA polymerase sigma subunit (sigma70/sigma32)
MARYQGDDELWAVYFAAADDASRREVAAAIVEHHLGFIRQYANRTALQSWRRDEVEAYVNELVIVAMKQVHRYDPDHAKQASFATFLRKSFPAVKWKLTAREDSAIPKGYETERLRVGMKAFIQATEAVEHRTPTMAEVCEHLGKVHGKKITPGRLQGILDEPMVSSGDEFVGDDDGGTARWDGRGMPTAADPADIVEARLTDSAASELVADLLAQVPLTDLEKAVMVERLMAPPREKMDGVVINPGPTPHRVLGRRFGISSEEVREAEAALLSKFRGVLGET